MSALKKQYEETVKGKLKEHFGFKNQMQIPKLHKIVVSMGVAEALKDKSTITHAERELTVIAGQKPIITKAKKSVSNFKLREGYPIGLKVTLRGKRMYDFMYRFIHIVSPRIRDFRGFSKKCDGQGNYSLGVDDQQIFPEVNLDEVKRVQGMNITFVTTAKNDEECYRLLHELGMPFKREK